MANVMDILKLCRLCLVKDEVNVPIFESQGDLRQIFLKITACLPVKVTKHLRRHFVKDACFCEKAFKTCSNVTLVHAFCADYVKLTNERWIFGGISRIFAPIDSLSRHATPDLPSGYEPPVLNCFSPFS